MKIERAIYKIKEGVSNQARLKFEYCHNVIKKNC